MKFKTKRKSNQIFNSAEAIITINGVLESHNALNIEVAILWTNMKTANTKTICKYCLDQSIILSGVFNNFNKVSHRKNHIILIIIHISNEEIRAV